jgi:hypothetical protein
MRRPTHSERVIDLDPRSIHVLRNHRDHQGVHRRALDAGYEAYDLVFPKPDGRPVHPDIFNNAFDRRVARTVHACERKRHRPAVLDELPPLIHLRRRPDVGFDA